MSVLKLVASLAFMLVLGACGFGNLDKLKRTTPVADPFNRTLSQEYLAFSESEAAQYDWTDSAYFAEKGLKAAYGQQTEPENISHWDLPPNLVPTIRDARKQLVDALKSDAAHRAPEKAAKAQFLFDCWVEQQEENWQTEEIAACRESFYETLDGLMNGAGEPAPAPVAETPASAPSLGDSNGLSYMVFFEHNSSKLTPEANHILDSIIGDITKMPAYEVVLNGHTDTSGGQEYNLKLSKTRAQIVKDKLIRGGVLAEHIILFAFGETDLREPTADGVRDPANRRVEIFVSQ